MAVHGKTSKTNEGGERQVQDATRVVSVTNYVWLPPSKLQHGVYPSWQRHGVALALWPQRRVSHDRWETLTLTAALALDAVARYCIVMMVSQCSFTFISLILYCRSTSAAASTLNSECHVRYRTCWVGGYLYQVLVSSAFRNCQDRMQRSNNRRTADRQAFHGH